MKLTNFTEVEANLKNKTIYILNQPEYIFNMFNIAEDKSAFELPVDECDLEDSDISIDENIETFADEELEKE